MRSHPRSAEALAACDAGDRRAFMPELATNYLRDVRDASLETEASLAEVDEIAKSPTTRTARPSFGSVTPSRSSATIARRARSDSREATSQSPTSARASSGRPICIPCEWNG
jgi:hypothetical protein